jgi:hypothetical protein
VLLSCAPYGTVEEADRVRGASTDRRSHRRGGHAPAPRDEATVALVRSEGQAQMMGGGLLATAARGSTWSRSHHIIGGVTCARGEGGAAPMCPTTKLWSKQTRDPICSSRRRPHRRGGHAPAVRDEAAATPIRSGGQAQTRGNAFHEEDHAAGCSSNA